MRLITYVRDGKESIGAWIGGDSQVVDLARAAELSGGADPPSSRCSR